MNLLEYYLERTGKLNKDVSSHEMQALLIAHDYFTEFNNPKVREIIKEEKQNLKV